MLGWNKSKKPDEKKAGAPKAAPVPAQASAPRQQATPRPAQPSRPAQAPQRSLPAMLLQQGKASREQLEKALAKQKETGEFLGEILVEEGILDESSLLTFLAKYCKIPHLSLLDYLIDTEVAALVPKEVCLQYRLIPIDKLGRNLTIAMVNPLNTQALQTVQQICPELRIKPILCAHKHFETVAAKVFGEQKRASGGVDLSASSFGIKLSPEEKKAYAERNAAAHAPAPKETPKPASAKEEEIPDAIAVESKSDFAEAKMNDSGSHKVRFSGEQTDEKTEEPDMNTETVFAQVFHGDVADEANLAEAHDDDAPEKILEDVTKVMMDSMRDTYEILARRMELFRGIDPENIARIFARGMTVEYEAGEVIFKKEQMGESLYLILNGSVAIEQDGQELALLGQGDMFGEMALISQGKRSADAIARDNISLLALKMDVIHNIMPRDVSVQILVNIILTLSRRLQEANAR
jgi:hypothetical protein